MRLRIPVRLSLWISATLLLFILSVGLLLSLRWFYGMKRTMQEYAKASVQGMANDLDKLFVQVDMAADLVAGELERIPPEKPEDVEPFLKALAQNIHQQCPEIVALSLLWDKDQLVPGETFNGYIGTMGTGEYRYIRWSDKEPFDYFLKDWYILPALLQKPVWTAAYESDANPGLRFLSYVVPFYKVDKKNGKRVFAGIVDLDLPVNSFARYLHPLYGSNSITLPARTEILLLNQFGHISCCPSHPDHGKQTLFSLCEAPANPDPADRENARNMLRDRSGMTTFSKAPVLGPDIEGCEVYYASCVNGWIVAAAVPRDWTYWNMLPSVIRLSLFTLFFLAVITGIIFSVCKRLTKPLETLSSVAYEVGKGNFTAPVPAFSSGDEVASLARSFRRMQMALTEYIQKLQESVVAKERAEGELNAAKAIQQNLLPDDLPPYPFCPGISAAAMLIPARGVGGDLYDIFPLGDGRRIAFLIGDVSGKGIPASIFMAGAQTLQRTLALSSDSPDRLMNELNDALSRKNGAGMFVTCWSGFLNTESGELHFTCAGHNPPVIRHKDGSAEFLRTLHGPPLAALEGMSYRSDSHMLQDGDTLLLYTDGITEAFHADGKTLFGTDRLLESVKAASSNSPDMLISSVYSAVSRFAAGAEQADDITMLAVHFSKPEPTNTQSAVFKATSDQLSRGNEFLEASPLFQRLSPADQMRLSVSFEEIFVNVASYAYPPGQEGPLQIDFFEENGEFRLRFTDRGKPFDPLKRCDPDITLDADERPIGGLGIFLVRKNSSSVSYERTPAGENVLTIGMKLPAGS